MELAKALTVRAGRWNTVLQGCKAVGQRRRTHDPASSVPIPLDSILIANRGEIALRVNKTAVKHGIRTTTLYTDPDAKSQHAQSSPWSFNLGNTAAYLDQDKIINIAKDQSCQAIHPGYGFLSENADFARKCQENGIKFIGPPASAIEDMGDKARSKEIMSKAGVPCVPGYHGSDQSTDVLAREAAGIGYPVLIKAVRGGGGKGMRISRTAEDFSEMLASAKSEAKNSFGNDEVLVEKYITTPRHIEVQVFADSLGNCVALGERDCSIQRRHQKILEESPAPNLDEEIRKDLWDKACAAAIAVNYEGAGTVEFIFDNDTGEFFFMEMNTRLQVEHPVTEMVTGLDLVHWQILIAEGKPLPLTQAQVEMEVSKRGHAIEARIYAENPDRGFVPDSGRLVHVRTPQEGADVRIDSGFVQGDEVSSHYDPMIAKLIVRGGNRQDAVRKLALALQEYEVAGPVTNIDFLKRICTSPDFAKGNVETGYIEKHRQELFPPRNIPDEVLVQAALASFYTSIGPAVLQPAWKSVTDSAPAPVWTTAESDYHDRTYNFLLASDDDSPSHGPESHAVQLRQISPDRFVVKAPRHETSIQVSSNWHPQTCTLTKCFPNLQQTSRLIVPYGADSQPMHLFTAKGYFRLLPTSPGWLAKALGTTETANSVLSPMPCKILRVKVQPGTVVKKDQPLVVIESMKMETVIRSPGEALVVRRVVHGEGEVVGSGIALVEFVDAKDTSV